MDVKWILAGSIVLQLAAAVIAFRLIFFTGRRAAWSLIGLALVFMAIRRIIPFVHLFSGNPSDQPDFINEVPGLALSLLMVLGFAGITPIFSAIKRSEKEVRKLNEDLERRVQERTAQLVDLNRQQQQEITERKKVEKELNENEEKLQSIAGAAKDVIIMIDDKGNISFWNFAAEKLFGYQKKEALGKNLHKLLAPEKYYNLYCKAFPEFTRTGKGNALGKTVELSALSKTGEENYYRTFTFGNLFKRTLACTRDHSSYYRTQTERD